MATVLLPRSLLALFPGVERRHDVTGATVGAVLVALDATRARACATGSSRQGRASARTSTSSWTGSRPTSPRRSGPAATVHVIPAVSGG